MLIKPEHLEFGDTIGIVAPASAPPEPETIDRSVQVLERLGFKVKLARNVRKRWGFLAGSDRERAADLMTMFADRKVKAIVCVRGGYGTARLLPLLDYRTIRANPKIFIGYSDITSLHCAFLTRANLISFHGPMLNSDFIKKDFPDFTRQSFLKTLMQPSAPGSIRQGYKRKTVSILRRGTASGPLIGGNISDRLFEDRKLAGLHGDFVDEHRGHHDPSDTEPAEHQAIGYRAGHHNRRHAENRQGDE